ncbi:unnamed protein product [Moneuplotes crassus]|uniref:Uncharacterized protein n=1 Tax=Euplotes crassus TaxID=5936 RepID=A0AAD1Y1X5_EUPCR|nr:unnamed protein product [Moneuplotes crassus]
MSTIERCSEIRRVWLRDCRFRRQRGCCLCGIQEISVVEMKAKKEIKICEFRSNVIGVEKVKDPVCSNWNRKFKES